MLAEGKGMANHPLKKTKNIYDLIVSSILTLDKLFFLFFYSFLNIDLCKRNPNKFRHDSEFTVFN